MHRLRIARAVLGLAVLLGPARLGANVTYDYVGGHFDLTSQTYWCRSQGMGVVDCSPCINQSDTQLGIFIYPRAFIGSCGDVCAYWHGTISGTVWPRLSIDGVMIDQPLLLPAGSYWQSIASSAWWWCTDGAQDCGGLPCGIDIQIDSQHFSQPKETSGSYTLRIPARDYPNGIPFAFSFCNEGLGWGVGCGAAGSVYNRWLLIAPSEVHARAFAAGPAPFTPFTGANVEVAVTSDSGGVVTATMVPGSPPGIEPYPGNVLPRYWELNTDMARGTFTASARFTYDPAEVGSANPSLLGVVAYDETRPDWVPLYTRVDTVAHTVTVAGLPLLSRFQIVANVPADAPVAEAPSEMALDPIRPNPVRGGDLLVRFALPNAADARLDVLDVTGRRVMSRSVSGAGWHVLALGKEHRLRPGLYMVRLSAGTGQRVRRAVLVD